MTESRLVIGFDPGTARTGFGAITQYGNRLGLVEYGLISTEPTTDRAERLAQLSRETGALLDRLQPESVAVEQLFFAKNTRTALAVAEGRGVLLARCAQAGIPVSEYTPMQVKQSVSSSGRADKQQVAVMVCRLLGIAEPPQPDDVTDALAIALTHAQWAKYPSP